MPPSLLLLGLGRCRCRCRTLPRPLPPPRLLPFAAFSMATAVCHCKLRGAAACLHHWKTLAAGNVHQCPALLPLPLLLWSSTAAAFTAANASTAVAATAHVLLVSSQPPQLALPLQFAVDRPAARGFHHSKTTVLLLAVSTKTRSCRNQRSARASTTRSMSFPFRT